MGGRLVTVRPDRTVQVLTVSRTSTLALSLTVQSRFARLANDLRARGDQVRLSAIDALGKLPEDEARELLDRALHEDRAPKVRAHAAKIIGESGRRLSRPALRRALNDGQEPVRKMALASLTKIEASEPLSPLRAALGSTQEDIRIEALKRLPALRASSPLVPGLIAQQLTDKRSSAARTAALDALYVLEGARSFEPVKIAMERAPKDVRSAALLRMGYAHQALDEEGHALLEAALDDEDAGVRTTAFHIMIGARPRLSSKLAARNDKLAQALETLSEQGSFSDESEEGALTDEDRQPLFAALACRSIDSALLGARALAWLADPRSTGALLQLSREQDTNVRRRVVEALHDAAVAMPDDDRLNARLLWLLNDSDAGVRNASFKALEALAKPQGPAGLLEHAGLALRASFEDIRTNSLQIIVRYGGQGEHAKDAELAKIADALLQDALDDEAAKVRSEAFRTLWAWHSDTPKVPLLRAASSRHADIRQRAAAELKRLKKEDWARDALIELITDTSSATGLAAYKALTETKEEKPAVEPHRRALRSPRTDVRAAGCKGCHLSDGSALRRPLVDLIDDEHPEVHLSAIEAVDALIPKDAEAFSIAFGSVFYELRVRAGELCAKRGDDRAVDPMKKLLSIPKVNVNRPSDPIRQRASVALAEVGHAPSIPFYVNLLDDEDATVREMGARGLAGACKPGREQPLVDALAHADLAVRSWAAEGLARLGDIRAIPVLAGTLKHKHRPIRLGSIRALVALGADGIRGLLQGLEDQDRQIQDLAFAIIVSRDIALARAKLSPDLLLSALSSAHPEIRFAAARALEVRSQGQELTELAQRLVGPQKPDRASEMKNWPSEQDRTALLNVVIALLASDHPEQRYSAARILELRPQPDAFWRQAKGLSGPSRLGQTSVPRLEGEDEEAQPRKKGWIRRLFGRRPAQEEASESGAQTGSQTENVIRALGLHDEDVEPAGAGFSAEQVENLAFGTYAGLVRQAPQSGQSDETHRVRRDCLERLAVLAKSEGIGRASVLPIFRRAVSDPHHLVRKASVTALKSIYAEGALEPLGLALQSSAGDVGRQAVDELIDRALAGDQAARAMAKQTLNAKSPEVRTHALSRLPKLFEAKSMEPWLLALSCQHADVRLSVVDRLGGSKDPRVIEALGKALESDHEDLRLKAAQSLANQGDPRTVEVLAAFLRSEDARVQKSATEALVALAKSEPVRARAAETVATRIQDDPDKTANRSMLINALGQIGDPAASPTLLDLLQEKEATSRKAAFSALLKIATDRSAAPAQWPDKSARKRYLEPLALEYLGTAAKHPEAELRIQAAGLLKDLEDKKTEVLLAKMLEDRESAVRVAACETLAFRAEYLEGASIEALEQALTDGRRELVLPAAMGLAVREKQEAFRPLLLVFKAGAPQERERAVFGMGTLGDARAIEELVALVDPKAETLDQDRFLAPAAAEALGAMLPKIKDEEKRIEVRDLVESLAKEALANVRVRAMTGLQRAGNARGLALLERMTGDRHESSQIRVHGAKLLGTLASESSEAVLAEALHEGDSTLRKEALAALAKVFPEDRTRVSLLALKSRHTDVSQPAARFLARRGEPATLVARIAEIQDPKVRRRLRQGLVRRGACPVPQLEQLLKGEESASRAEAAWIAGAGQKVELRSAIVVAAQKAEARWKEAPTNESLQLHEEAWLASLWAANQLSAQALAQAKDAAQNAQAPASVRKEALHFIQGQGGPSELPIVQSCLSASSAEVRSAAAAAAAAIAPDQSASLLEATAVADAASMVPMVDAAIPVAGRQLLSSDSGRQLVLPVVLGRKRLEELIAIAQAPGKDPLRLIAIASLGRIGGDRAEDALRAILDNQSEEEAVRVAAYKAIRRLQRAAAKKYDDEESHGVELKPESFGTAGSVDEDDDDEYDDEDEDYDDDDYDDDDEDDDDD